MGRMGGLMVVNGKDVHGNAWDSLLVCIIGRCCRLSGGIDRLGSRTGLRLLLARGGNGSIAISSSQSVHHGGCHFPRGLVARHATVRNNPHWGSSGGGVEPTRPSAKSDSGAGQRQGCIIVWPGCMRRQRMIEMGAVDGQDGQRSIILLAGERPAR